MKLKDLFRKHDTKQHDPQKNPLAEKTFLTESVIILGETQEIAYRWIKNANGHTKGAQGFFYYRDTKIPLIASSPRSDTFTLGITIGISQELTPRLKRELQRLKEEETLSHDTFLTYVKDFDGVILWRKNGSKPINNNLEYWKAMIRNTTQPLIDDFSAFMPCVAEIYGM